MRLTEHKLPPAWDIITLLLSINLLERYFVARIVNAVVVKTTP
jgi:hypothetical protein